MSNFAAGASGAEVVVPFTDKSNTKPKNKQSVKSNGGRWAGTLPSSPQGCLYFHFILQEVSTQQHKCGFKKKKEIVADNKEIKQNKVAAKSVLRYSCSVVASVPRFLGVQVNLWGNTRTQITEWHHSQSHTGHTSGRELGLVVLEERSWNHLTWSNHLTYRSPEVSIGHRRE